MYKYITVSFLFCVFLLLNQIAYSQKPANTLATPVIGNISKTIFTDGETVKINGQNFGSVQGSSYVSFNGKNAESYLQWSDVTIVVIVPEGISSGKLSVWVGGVSSNEINYTFQKKFKLMETVWVKAGTFLMGTNDTSAYDNKPQHQITITRDFEISVTEVSQYDYKKVMDGANPSQVTDTGDSKPVQQVTFLRALEFCNRLSDMENYPRAYSISENNVIWDKNSIGYRLPTEAEWEYAARSGRDTGYTTDEIKEMGWVSENAENHMKPVRTKKPNAWGIYDMFGNVNEWCWDLYSSDYYAISPENDPSGPETSDFIDRIIRGGSYVNGADMCNSTLRSSFPGSDLDYLYNIGFRIVRNKIPLSAEQNKIIDNIYLFPNPAMDYIWLSGAEGEISIYNTLGEIVLLVSSVGDSYKIDISGLPPGVYFVQVGDRVVKFIKI